MSTKVHDWFAVTINSNNVELGDNPYVTLYANGITPDTTDLKDEDFYKNVPQVKEMFTKNGEFDNVAFKQAYQSAQRTFTEYAEINFAEQLLNAYGTTPYDSSLITKPEKRVNHFQAVLTPHHDKNRSTHGTANLWEAGSPTFSDREVAQANFVRDENGNILDWTPNDKAGIFKSLFTPSLVYATYDEDVYDKDGMLIHQKGELKLDEKGDPYTELLGHREAYGKDIVKWTDTLSVEGTFWNDIDVFDSDSLDKSVVKTVMETALMLLPYFTKIGSFWGYANAAFGLTKAAPSLIKSLNGLITNDNSTSFGKKMTEFENFMGRFGTSSSDNAQGRFFSMENLGDIITSSANQLFAQRQIAELAGKWKPFVSNEANKKLAQNLSIGYMSITSATESYGRFKAAGAEDWLAGLGSVLTIGSFYLLLNRGYFKNKLFENTWLDEDIRTVKNISSITEHAGKTMFGSNLSTVTQEAAKKGVGKWWDTIKKGISKLPYGAAYESRALLSRSMNEGVEEFMEEVAQDTIVGLTKALELIGIDCTKGKEDLNFGWSFEEASKRYGASFMGGFIGGAVFEANTQWNLYKDPNYKKMINSTPYRKMTYDILRGKADKYRDAIRSQGAKKLNGNYNLSATPETVTGPDGKVTQVYKAGTDTDNQNLAVTNALLQMVDNIESICNNHHLIWTDAELLKKVLDTESVQDYLKTSGRGGDAFLANALMGNQSEAEAIVNGLLDLTINSADGSSKYSIGQAVAENVLMDVNNIRDEILDIETEIQTRLSKFPLTDIQNEESRNRIIKSNKALSILSKRKKDLENQYKEIIEGKHANHFLTQVLMFFNQDLRDRYIGFGQSRDGDRSTKNIQNYAQLNFHVDYDSLADDDEVKQLIRDDYEKFILTQKNWLRRTAEMHIKISEDSAELLRQIDSDIKDASLHENYSYQKQKLTIKEFMDRMDEKEKEYEHVISEFRTLGLTDPNDDPKLKDAIENLALIRRVRPEYAKLPKEQTFDSLFISPNLPSGNNDSAVIARLDFVTKFYEDAIANKNIGVDDRLIKQLFNNWGMNVGLSFKQIETDLGKAFWDLTPFVTELGWTVEQAYEFINNGGTVSFAINEDDFARAEDLATEAINEANIKPKLDALKASLISIEQSFKSNPKKAIVEIQNLINELSKVDEHGIPVFNIKAIADSKNENVNKINSIKDLVHYFFNPGNLVDPITSAEKLFSLLDKAKPSPLMQLIQDMSMKILGNRSRIFELIEKQKANVHSVGYNQYSLSKRDEKDMRDAEGILNIVSGLLEGSLPGNINELINTKRGDKSFTIISENTAQILKAELEFVKKQFDAFKKVSEINEGNRIQENKNIAKYDSVKRFIMFQNPKGVLKNIENALGITFSDLMPNDLNLPSTEEEWKNFTDKDYDNFYVAESKFKNKLYDWFSKLESDKQIKVFAKIGEIAAGCETTTDEFSAKLSDKVGDWGNIRYLMSNLATGFNEFQGLYKTATDKIKNFLPFYPQEFVIRDAYSSFERSDLYNAFINALYTKTKEKTSDKKFFDDMEVILNFFFINGIPGSGKSSACTKILVDVLKLKYPDLTVIGLVQDASRLKSDDSDTESFGEVVGIQSDNCFTADDFIEQFVYKGLANDKKANGNHSTIKIEDGKFDLSIFKKKFGKSKVIILMDEATFTNEAQYKALSKFTSKLDHAAVMGLGDFYQSGTDSDYTDVTDVFFQSSIRLTSTFRSTNNGKALNERNARTVLRSALDLYHNDVSIDETKLDTEVFKNLEILKQDPLIGFVDNNGLIYGDVRRNSSDIKNIVDTLKAQYKTEDKTPSICIITTKPENYNSLVGDGIEVKNARGAQGGQWDYVISDYNFSFEENGSFFQFKQFYTIMTRAKKGTVWTGAIGIVDFSETEDAVTVVGADLNQDKIREEYVNWRKSLFDLIGITSTESGTSSSTTSSTSSTSTHSTSASSTTGSGTSSIPTGVFEDPSDDDSGAEIMDLYSPVTAEEIETLRYELYEKDTTDPEILDFRKKHRKHIEDYEKRKASLLDGGLDFDAWFKWVQDEDNLFRKSPIDQSVNLESHRNYLIYVSEIIAEYLNSDFDKTKLQVFRDKYGTPGSPFTNVTNDLIRSIENESAQIQLHKITEENGIPTNIVYLTYTDKNGNAQALPISVNHSTFTDCSYKLKEVSTEFVAKPIPISSNGRKFLELKSASGKISIMDRIMIFKGINDKDVYDETNNPSGRFKLTDKEKTFNSINRGKAFILIGKITDPSKYEHWDSFFNVRYTDKGEIDSFITEDGNVYASLAGVQRKCTTSNLIDILTNIQKAYIAQKEGRADEYTNAVDAIRTIVGESFSVKGRSKTEDGERVFLFYDESAIYNENNLFSYSATQFLLNRLYRHFKQPLVTISSKLNREGQFIRLSYYGNSDSSSIITIYRGYDGNLRITLNPERDDTNDIIIDEDKININNNEIDVDQYLINLFSDVIIKYNSELKAKFDRYDAFIDNFKLNSISDENFDIKRHVANLLTENKKNGSYVYNFETGYTPNDELSNSFILDGFGKMMMGWDFGDEDGTFASIKNFILANDTLFKHDLINLSIFADEFKEGKDITVWGWINQNNALGYGWDLVDILPTSYKMKFNMKSDHNLIVFDDTVTEDGTLSIENSYVDMSNKPIINLTSNGIKVDGKWLNKNISNSTTFDDNKTYVVEMINTDDKKIKIQGISTSYTLKTDSFNVLLSKFKDPTLTYGPIKIIGNKMTYNGVSIQKVIGFTKTNSAIAYLMVDDKIVSCNLNDNEVENRLKNKALYRDDIVKIIYNDSTVDIITVNENGYKRFNNVLSDDVMQIQNFVISTSTVEQLEINYWDKRYQLNSTYDNFKNTVKQNLNLRAPNEELANRLKNEIISMLDMTTSVEDAIDAINEMLKAFKYRLGMEYVINSRGALAPNVNESERTPVHLGYLVFTKYLQPNGIDSDIINVEYNEKSPNFSVYLQSDKKIEKIDFEWNGSNEIVLLNNTSSKDKYEEAFKHSNIVNVLSNLGITSPEQFKAMANVKLLNKLYNELRALKDRESIDLIKNLLNNCY